MNELQVEQNELIIGEERISLDNYLEMLEDGLRKRYLARLTEMQIAPIENLASVEDDFIDNVRVFHVTELVYKKDESVTDKFTTVYNTLAAYKSILFLILDSDGMTTNIYLGVRNNESVDVAKRSTVTLGDTLKQTLIGHFPGTHIENIPRSEITRLSKKMSDMRNVTSVSVTADNKNDKETGNEKFVQGLEKLVLAMYGRAYTGIIIAESQTSSDVQMIRRQYQHFYTEIFPLQKVQITTNESKSESRSQSFSELDGKQKAALLGRAFFSVAGGAAALAGRGGEKSVQIVGGAIIGSQLAGQFGSIFEMFAPVKQLSESKSQGTTITTENKVVTDLLEIINESLKRVNEFDSYGMWNAAAYFLSNDMATAEIAASNYRSLMNGEKSGRELSAINSWRSDDPSILGNFDDLTSYLSRFLHPKFVYAHNETQLFLRSASTAISGRELGLQLGLPRASVPGLPVIEHAEFGKNPHTYDLHRTSRKLLAGSTADPLSYMILGKVFDLGQVTNRPVELNNDSLKMHTFITGSTGSGKSNTVYQMLSELYQDRIPFLVIEPAKGEYKDVFGNWPDVRVFSTNPKIAPLINLNPFKFPDSIHVLEHVDGLIEIFSVCWPMYDAMPAFFKKAILNAYESVGWDLGSSSFENRDLKYPDFSTVEEELTKLIDQSDYAPEVKSNYKGALLTRVSSLTVGLNKFIFTAEQTPYKQLFDENCILDISRVKSTETKSLLMGLMVYILNEYRMDQKSANNSALKHITVLEEAHNILKSRSGNESDVTLKSVEMITQTIAEIRTYGEGFIIVDQSPSSVDIAAIKNTNTKIVLRTPEANDRESVGHSMGLTDAQMTEIAKLPSGVAVVYQNNWVSPILTRINKADVQETTYRPEKLPAMLTQKVARTRITALLMQDWEENTATEEELADALKILDLSGHEREELSEIIDKSTLRPWHWREDEYPKLVKLLQSVLGLTPESVANAERADILNEMIASRLEKRSFRNIGRIGSFITLRDKRKDG